MTLPSDDRAALAKAYHWAARGMTVAIGMVVPGMAGYFVDNRLGTKVLFTILGFALAWHSASGNCSSWLMQLTNPTERPPGRTGVLTKGNSSKECARERTDQINAMATSCSHWNRMLTLTGALCATGAIVLPIAFAVNGWLGPRAHVSVGDFLGAGLIALWLVRRRNGPEMVQIQVLWGMLPRMGIPLAAFLVVHVKGGPLAENGFVY